MDYTALVDHYGYLVLFVALMLELIIFGIPTEILMAYAGFLVFKGDLSWPLAILTAAVGSCVGISVSYFIGQKLGFPFFKKYGHKVHMGPDRLEKFSGWFNKYGNGLIIVAYFIPGIRHITGYFSGITKLDFRKFMPFAYLGAFIWVSTFISLGKLLGPQWQMLETYAKKYMIIAGVLIIMVALVLFLIKRNLENIKRFILKGLETAFVSYQSRRGLTLLITVAAVVFIVFVSLSIGVVQDYFGGDYGQFNRITLIIFHRLFQNNWAQSMSIFLHLSSRWALVGVAVLTVLWILTKGQHRLLEMQILVLLIGGGIVYVKLMNFLFKSIIALFHWSTVATPVIQNDQLVLAVIMYGFLAFLLSRHLYHYRLKLLTTILALLILFAMGLGHVFFHLLRPSDILIGYVFGGLWLSFVVLFLEILRLYRLNFSSAA